MGNRVKATRLRKRPEPKEPKGTFLRGMIIKFLFYILLFSITIAIFSYIHTRTNVLCNVDPIYINFFFPCGLGIITPFFFWNDINRFKDKASDFLYLIILISCSVIYFNVGVYIKYISFTTTETPTISNQNLEEVQSYNFVYLDYIEIDKERRGWTQVTDSHGKRSQDLNYQVYKIKDLPDVYLGATMVGELEGKDLKEIPLHDIVVKPISDKFTYKIYCEAVEKCMRINGDQYIESPVIFALSSKSDVTTGVNSPIWIILSLLICCIIMYVMSMLCNIQCQTKSDITNKTISCILRDYVYNPEGLVVLILPILWIIILFIEVFNGYGSGTQNTEAIDRLGAVSYQRVFVEHQYWRILAANFVHAGFKHLLGNLLYYVMAVFLFFIDSVLDNRLKTFHLVTAFLVGGLIASFCVPYYQHDVICCGASCGVLAMLGFLLAKYVVYSKKLRKSFKYLARPILAALFITLISSLLPGVSLLGHVIGFVGGLLYGMALYVYIDLKQNKRNTTEK